MRKGATVLLLAFAILCAGVVESRSQHPGHPIQGKQPAAPVHLKDTVSDSLVHLWTVNGKGMVTSAGSGFFVSNGMIVTSFKLLKPVDMKSRIFYSRGRTPGRSGTAVKSIVTTDPEHDLAVLEGSDNTPALKVKSDANPGAGSVWLAASPERSAVTWLSVRVIDESGKDARAVVADGMASSAVQGAPLVDELGNVVGMVSESTIPSGHGLRIVPSTDINEIIHFAGAGNGVEGSIQGSFTAEAHKYGQTPGVTEQGPYGTRGTAIPPSAPKEAASSHQKIINKPEAVLQNSVVRKVEPQYPAIAHEERVTGKVIVEVTIDEDGNVMTARWVSGHPLLRDAAVDAVKQWKFAPARLSDVPAKVIGMISIYFELD